MRHALRALAVVAALAACEPGGTQAPPPQPSSGDRAAFDYWVLSLSWSPEYCASSEARPDSNQCARPHGFVVHGLWPQFDRGYPEFCDTRTRVDTAIARRLEPLVPDRGLVFHQWRKHGSCSGLSPEAYFETLERAAARVRSPGPWLRGAAHQGALRHHQVEQAFIEANPGLTPEAIAVDCRSRYLREVRVCLDHDLAPRACGVDVRDRCAGTLRIRPTSEETRAH